MTAMTVNDIFTRVQRSFGDEAGIQVTEADVIRWINDAQREAVMQHEGLLMTETDINSVADQQDYALPSTCFTILHVYYRESESSQYYALRFQPVAALNVMAPDWLNTQQSHNPWFYTKLESNNEIKVYPKPDASTTAGFKVIHTRYANKVTSSASTIDLPEYYHSYVEHFCMMKAYEKDEDMEKSQLKAQIVQSTLDENRFRESWFGRENYPTIVDVDPRGFDE